MPETEVIILKFKAPLEDYEHFAQEELAVHKKKLGELKGWLTEAFDHRGRIRKYRVEPSQYRQLPV